MAALCLGVDVEAAVDDDDPLSLVGAGPVDEPASLPLPVDAVDPAEVVDPPELEPLELDPPEPRESFL